MRRTALRFGPGGITVTVVRALTEPAAPVAVNVDDLDAANAWMTRGSRLTDFVTAKEAESPNESPIEPFAVVPSNVTVN